MDTLIRHAVFYAMAAIAAASAPKLYAQQPDVEAMKRSLESTISLLRQINNHERRITALEERTKGGDPTVVVTPHEAGAGPADGDAPNAGPASDSRPVVQCLVPNDGDWCTYCNWWKARGDRGLPFQLEFVETGTEPMFGYPTFYVPNQPAGKDRYIANPVQSDEGVRGLVAKWSEITGGTVADQVTDAAQSPTPYNEICRAIEKSGFQRGQTFSDIGCGDGRALIIAVEQFGASKATGIEIDPNQAAVARRRVDQAGLSDRVEIIVGDATKMDLPPADLAFVYLYPGTLQDLQPQLTSKFGKVISYMHHIPGVNNQIKRGSAYFWERPSSQPQTQLANSGTDSSGRTIVGYRPYALYGGHKYYGHCCGNMSCPMGKEIMRQIRAREHVEPIYAQQPAVNPAVPLGHVVVQQNVAVPQRQVRYCRSCGRR